MGILRIQLQPYTLILPGSVDGIEYFVDLHVMMIIKNFVLRTHRRAHNSASVGCSFSVFSVVEVTSITLLSVDVAGQSIQYLLQVFFVSANYETLFFVDALMR